MIPAVAAVVVLLVLCYVRWMAPTRIATLNFPDFSVEKMIRSNDNRWVRIEPVDLDDPGRLGRYDVVLVRVHGSSMDASHLAAIRRAMEKGAAVYSTEIGNAEINSLSGRELEYVDALMGNGCVRNYRSLFNYLRRNVDRKAFFNGGYVEPVIIPTDYYFHLEDDAFFATYDEYMEFYRATGRWHEGAPNVALLAGNINMQNSNSEHMAAIIESLESRGMNVFPINSLGARKLDMIEAVHPDVIVNRPHGRLVMGGGESGTELLKRLNAPVLAPVTVSDLYDNWLKDKQGMAAGGMTSMSVVMPELDGAVAPFAVAAQFDRGGLKLFDAIPVHTEKFCSMVEKYARLRTKPNSEKRVAIYYYKGTGKGAVSASGIEGVESLYNTLAALRDAGYDVSGLPASARELERMIQRQGSVLGPYALGAYDTFLREGDPALVETAAFAEWAGETFPAELMESVEAAYGEAPGEYMAVERDGKKYIAVARIRFGNVAILPQPMAAAGDDVDKIVHGVDSAPAYPYLASYLWTRKEFRADALVHFGTHGSLEFIPGKQVALSDYDWTDAIVGDMPHFYIYTIGNIGEGVIAKRRSYATLVDHMTAPFMRSDLYDELATLSDRVHRFNRMEDGPVKENLRASITDLARAENIVSALSIDSTALLTDEDMHRVHIYLEEIEESKVSDGLYTLGVPYSEENLDNTARLMAIDPVRYALAGLDVAGGRVPASRLDDQAFIAGRYNAAAEGAIGRMMAGADAGTVLAGILPADDMEVLRAALRGKEAAAERRGRMMEMMTAMAAEAPVQEPAPFLDAEGRIIEAAPEDGDPTGDRAFGNGSGEDAPEAGRPVSMTGGPASATSGTTGEMSAMDRMAAAAPVGMEAQAGEDAEERYAAALMALYESIADVGEYRENLRRSTDAERDGLLNALGGGYVHPSSAGDPIVNPAAVPTGRNFYSINPETTPTDEAWKVGRRLAESLLEAELADNGRYPEKVSFTLWATDFISSEGATVAQILYLLGVEPLRDGFGYIRSLRLIPAERLGRPRIDVVVQTSGQLRDIAASRLELINSAIAMAAAAEDGEDNYVRKGFLDAERMLLDKGFSPVDARRYAGERIFGGAGGNYGTGIMGMVEAGDSWEERSQIAERYLENMGAIYSANGSGEWGELRDGVFEAALLNTSVVVQPRSGNTWGPLSLDHVYEFMGGLSAAVEQVTGNDPTAYFNDFRNVARPKVQGLKEAIGVETGSTVFNPKYIAEMMKGGSSSMETFAETFRNTFGWNAMKPGAIDQHIWNEYYDIYVQDGYGMGLRETFSDKNPYALQEMTAVMLEASRKRMWHAAPEQVEAVAELHAELVRDHAAGCSGFVCDNAALRDYIADHVSGQAAQEYLHAIDLARQVQLSEQEAQDNVVLKKEDQTRQHSAQERPERTYRSIWYMAGAIVLVLVAVALRHRKKR